MGILSADYPRVRSNSPRLVRDRRDYVYMLYILTGITGTSDALGNRSELMSLLTAVLYASAATQWAMVDSRLSGSGMLRITQEMFFFTWPLATLVYLFRTRTFRGLGLWFLNVLALYFTLYSTFYSTHFFLNWIHAS